MDIKGKMEAAISGGSNVGMILKNGTGAISTYNDGSKVQGASLGSSYNKSIISFTASNSWAGATSSNGSHSHTITKSITLNRDTNIYGKSTTVQPNSLKLRVKTKAK